MTRLSRQWGIVCGMMGLLLILSACAQGTYPGGVGAVKAAAPSKRFNSHQEAAAYVNSFAIWEAEESELVILQPQFTIVDNLINGAYQNSSIEVAIPYRVPEGTEPGSYTLHGTLFTRDRSDSLVLAGTVRVMASEQANNRRTGTLRLILGIVLLIAGIIGIFFVKDGEGCQGWIVVGAMIVLGIAGIVNGIKLLSGG